MNTVETPDIFVREAGPQDADTLVALLVLEFRPLISNHRRSRAGGNP
ncbi:MAG: hypothetical protein V7642_7186 [Burkholderiales bacterium]|jgi:hypothetical protein